MVIITILLSSLLGESVPGFGAVKQEVRPAKERLAIAGVQELITQGLAENAAGRFSEALPLFRQAAALEPSNPFVLYNLGTVLGMLHRYSEAADYLRMAVQLSPDFLPAWANLGSMYNHLGMPVEALSAFRQVVRLDPKDTTARYESGVNLLRLNRVTEASIEEEELRSLNPDLADNLLRQIISAGEK